MATGPATQTAATPRASGPRSAPDGLQTSIVEAATARIRDEIMSARIRPGERIRLNTLEALLGVSHIPIREALRRLEGEGLVENIPQRGAIATPLSLEEFDEIYDLRKLVEPAIAARAVPMSPERVSQIARMLDEMDEISDGWRSPRFPELHQEFHWLILEAGANRTIEQVIRQLWQKSQRYIVFAMTTVERHAAAVAAQHRRLLNAVKRGDGERLAHAVTAHLEHTESVTRDALQLVQHEHGLVRPDDPRSPGAAR